MTQRKHYQKGIAHTLCGAIVTAFLHSDKRIVSIRYGLIQRFFEKFWSTRKGVHCSFVILLSLFSIFSLEGQSILLSKTTSNATPDVEEPFNYILDLSCSSSTGPCQNVVIRDTLPGFVEFLNFSSPLPSGIASATYDPATREALITFDNNTLAGTSIQLNIQVQFPYGTLLGSVAVNYAYASSFNAGSSQDFAIATSNTGMTVGDFPDEKSGSHEITLGGYQYWEIEVGNIGFNQIDNYTIIDTIPIGMYLEEVRTPEFVGVDHPANLFYMRSDNPGVWVLWQAFNLDTRHSKYVPSLGLPPGVFISQVKIEMGSVPGTGLYNPYIYPNGFDRSWVLYATESGSKPIGDSYVNCANYSGTTGGTPITDRDCYNTLIIPTTNELVGGVFAQDLLLNETNTFSIEDTIVVGYEFASPGPMGNDILGGVISIVLPPNVSYVPGTWYYNWGESTADYFNPVIETGVTMDGREIVRFVYDASFSNEFAIEPTGGWEGFNINFKATVEPSATVGQHTIEMYFNATGMVPDNCGNADVDNLLNGYAADYCLDTDNINIVRPPGGAGLQSSMKVIGTLDTDYSAYPTRGLTVPGGISDYRITIKNPNSTRVNRLVFVTVLPHIGDTEVLDVSTPRYSEWQPSLAQAVTSLSSGLSVEYSTVSNPCRDDLAGSNPTPFPAGCNTAGWSSTPPLDITDVTALRFDYGNTRLNQNDSLVVDFAMRSPVDALPDTSIAWNSFAYKARNFDDNIDLLPAEPIKVGIELRPGNVPIVGDFVWEDLEPNGQQDIGEVGIDGVRVELYHDVDNDGVAEPTGPDSLELWTVTSAGGKYLFSDFDYGRYFIVFSDLPSGFIPTYQDVAHDTLDSDGLISSVMLFDNTTIDYSHDLGLYNGALPPICGSIDSDGDTIGDVCDLDDDNDGILDVDEGHICETLDISSLDGTVATVGDFNAALINLSGATIQLEDPLTFAGSASLDEFGINDNHETGSYGLELGVFSSGPADYLEARYTFSKDVCDFNARLLDIDMSDAIDVYGYLNGVAVTFTINYQGVCVNYNSINTFSSICLFNSSPTAGNVNQHAINIQFNSCIDSLVIRSYENGSGAGGAYTLVLSPSPTCTFEDTDGDGINNELDLDSDNDGIFDVDEAGHTAVDGDNDGMIDGAPITFGTNGLFDNLETIVDNGIINYNISDSETSPDGIYDPYELDSDGDGCYDGREESISDPDNDGLVGSGTPSVLSNGLVIGHTYGDPPNNFWQNPSLIKCVDLSGRVYEDINYGGGNGRDYTSSNTSAVSSGWASGVIGINSVRIELYDNAGAFVTSTSTDASGQYTFTDVGTGTYSVRAVSETISSNRGSNSTGQTIIPVQTYRHTGAAAISNEVGGSDPSVVDATSNTTNSTLASLSTASTVAQSVSTVVIGLTNIGGVDFGYNFDLIVNTNDAGQGSIRQFILNNNELGNSNLDQEDTPTGGVNFAKPSGTEHSIFMIPGAGVHRTIPSTQLPTITDDQTHLTGYTQDGSAQGTMSGRTNTIELTGNTILFDGININANHTTISGLVINDFRVGINGTIARNNIFIWGNYIGTMPDGLTGFGNAGIGLNFRYITSSFIGTDGNNSNDANEGNLVSNNYQGMQVRNTSDVSISGNIVGLNSTGTTSMGNTYNGIYVGDATGTNIIGFNDNATSTILAHFRNISSGNGNDGVRIVNSNNQVVAGNYFGTDISGTLPRGNANYGVQLTGTSSNNFIGTDSDGNDDLLEPNIISGNGSGIRLLTAGTGTNNRISGNFIGVDVTGNVGLGNLASGLDVNGSFSGTIIGTNGDNVNDAQERNVISGNGDDGIRASDSNNNIIAGNYVGVGANGTTSIPNDKRGIYLHGTASNNIIGYSPSMANTDELIVGNFVKNNGGTGIAHAGTGTQNRISRNQLENNGSLGIDLGYDSVTSNDNGDGDSGANNLLNFPVLTSVSLLNNSLTIRGFAPSGSRIEFFIADAGPNPSPLPLGYTASFGEGRLYLFEAIEGSASDSNASTGSYNNDGTGIISIRTQSQFNFTFDVTGLGLTDGIYISSTATDTSDNTSEFSNITEIILNCGTATMNPHVMYFGRN